MRYRNCFYSVAACVVCALSALPQYASAKVGETRNAVEQRFHSKVDGAYQYVPVEARLREMMELPYKKMFLIFPVEVQSTFYFKRSDSSLSVNGDTILQNDLYGWEINIQYENGKSVMEFYRRQGDPMTREELVAIMETMAAAKNAKWQKVDFVSVTNQWDLLLQNGQITEVSRDSKGKIISKDASLEDILPISPVRFIYLEIPQEVLGAISYGQSPLSKYMDIEGRNAHEAYRKYVDNQSAYNAAKTATNAKKAKISKDQKITVQKVNVADGYTVRGFETAFTEIENSMKDGSKVSIFKYYMPDVFFGDKPLKKPTREVRLTEYIPIQPETAFGYNYVLSDGSVRAKIYRNGVLFLDSNFDKKMRDYMESVYKSQSEQRKSEAKSSINLF